MQTGRKPLFLSLGCIFLIGILLKNPAFFVTAVQNGLSLCAKKVVPSLFPFLVLSRCLVGFGFLQFLPKKFCNRVAIILGIPSCSVPAVLLGALCGFPIGWRMAVEDYRENRIDRKELTKIASLVTLPSPAFVVGTLGTLFCNAKIGWFAEIALLFSAFLTACIRKRKKKTQSQRESPSLSAVQSISTVFSSAVASSAEAVLSVCAYVVFFSAFAAAIENACNRLFLPCEISICLQGITEMTAGIKAAGEHAKTAVGVLFAGFFLGFSGFSVQAQLLSFCPENGLQYRRFLFSKICLGLLTALFLFLLSSLFG